LIELFYDENKYFDHILFTNIPVESHEIRPSAALYPRPLPPILVFGMNHADGGGGYNIASGLISRDIAKYPL